MARFSIGAQDQYSVEVDDRDLEWLLQWSWSFKKSRTGLVYAARCLTLGSRTDGTRYNTCLTMHKALMVDRWGKPPPTPDHSVDHRDRNTLRNTENNLGWATRQEQEANKGWRFLVAHPGFPQQEIPF